MVVYLAIDIIPEKVGNALFAETSLRIKVLGAEMGGGVDTTQTTRGKR